MAKVVNYVEGQKLIDSGFTGKVLTMRFFKSKDFGYSIMQPVDLYGGWVTSTKYEVLVKGINSDFNALWNSLVSKGFEVIPFFDDEVIYFDYVED